MGTFNNQYLLTTSDSTLRLPDSFEHHGSVSRHAIYASEHLSVATPDSGRDIVVLGDIIDPGDPTATNEDITEDLVSRPDGRSLFERLQRYSGRFVVAAAGAEGTVAVPDASAQRRVLYTDDAETITSSPKLFLDAFGYEQRTDPAVAEFLDSAVFWENDAAWPGTKTADRRLTRVLPNHYLDVDEGTVERRPLHQPPISTRRDVLDLIEETLTGTLAGITERYDDVRFSLTAGWDSRLLLAAAEGIEDRVRFRTFLLDMGLDHPDIWVPTALANALDIDYRILRPRSLTDEFAAVMKENYLNPRLSGMWAIQQFYFEGSPSETVILGGNSGEIMRAKYRPIESPATPERLAELYLYPDSAFARGEFAEWLPGAKQYAERTGIDIFDLFHWEHRTGNWVARTNHEIDIAGNRILPLNNYNLFLAGLSIPERERMSPQYSFFEELIEEMRPEVLSYPINPRPPQGGPIKDNLHRIADRHESAARARTAYLWLRDHNPVPIPL